MKKKPNIVYFLVDDMGYGDISALNPEGKIKTPNIDRFSDEGMTFTDAHSTSSVCSPSRYSILTGRYNWRTHLQKGIVEPYGDPLIDINTRTLPKILKKQNYKTACIGKWHLGMGWDFEKTKDFLPDHDFESEIPIPYLEPTERQKRLWHDSFSKPVKGGPIKAGFDYYFGVDIPNWPPYCYIKNDRTVGIPQHWLDDRLFGNHQASWQGPAMEYWNFEQLLPRFSKEADEYISQQAKNDEPFFLYLSMTSPHTPLAVNKKWIGSSGLQSLYADFVVETDAIFGQVMRSLEDNNLTRNTIVVFTSDNGCAPYIGVDKMEEKGHFPSGEFRGYKSDAWDGGHRIPLIIRWPEQIKAGSKSNCLVSLADFPKTISDILEEPLDEDEFPDSFGMLPIFKDPSNEIRRYLIQHSWFGKFAIRDRNMKLVLAAGSGGWTSSDKLAEEEGLPQFQLYDMDKDPGEKTNLYPENTAKAREMIIALKEIVDKGRSTPGKKLENDTTIDIFKVETTHNDELKTLDDI